MKKIICVFLVLVAIMLTACSNNEAADKLSVVEVTPTPTAEVNPTPTAEVSNLKVYYGYQISNSIEIPTYKTYEDSHNNAYSIEPHRYQYDYYLFFKEEISNVSVEYLYLFDGSHNGEKSLKAKEIDKNLWRTTVYQYMYYSATVYITFKFETSDGEIHWMTWVP